MMMSMYSGVSGLKSQQTKLDVIGNNIANVNTVAYKAQRVTFADLLSQTIANASSPNEAANTGGTNPKQIGLGVTVGAIDTNMNVGSTQYTGNSLDLSIDGNGFFIVQGGSGGSYQFTRAGNFGVDTQGNLTVGGLKVCGWLYYDLQSDGTYKYDTEKSVEPINLFADSYNGNKLIIAPKATSTAILTGSLDSSAEAQGDDATDIGTDYSLNAATTMTVYDALGNSYDVQVKFCKCFVDSTDTDNPITTWYWEITSSSDNLDATGSGYIAFDKNGKTITTDSTNYNTNPQVTFTPQGTSASTTSFSVNLDFSNISTYASNGTNNVTVSSIDGYEMGELLDMSIDSSGVIIGVYSNGEKQPLGMIALTTFDNPGGLKKIGSNLYVTTVNSGYFEGGVAAGTGGCGTLTSGTLEMSNVDLAEQFSEMMITQRAYQANSKVISTADQMLQTVINMVS